MFDAPGCRLRQHQRKFLNAINDFRRIKWDQRKLQERGNSLLDIGKLHSEMHETLWEMHRTQDQFITQIDALSQRIADLQATVLCQQACQGTSLPANQQRTPPVQVPGTTADSLSPFGFHLPSPLVEACTAAPQQPQAQHHQQPDSGFRLPSVLKNSPTNRAQKRHTAIALPDSGGRQSLSLVSNVFRLM